MHQDASRDHVILALPWRTGMCRSALRALDVDDLKPDQNAVGIHHRPDTGTPLKNGTSGERSVSLGPRWYQVVADYVDGPRIAETDEHGRRPLVTSVHG